jgi:hypothetical protein
MAKPHKHGNVVHAHDHFHVTHYGRPGENVTHLAASHRHQHNHPALSHEHEAHKNQAKEHQREGHIHDHAEPVRSARAR